MMLHNTKFIVRPCGETLWPHASPPRIITGSSSKNWPLF